ncbi:MAG: aldehyde dehydrogenase family protein [Bacteroidia bacterium]
MDAYTNPTTLGALPDWWTGMQEAGQRMAQENAEARVARLNRLSQALQDHEKAILEALQTDLGKPLVETQLTEMLPVYLEIKHFKKNLKQWMKDQKVRPHFPYLLSRSKITWQPKGTVLIIAPWNYPLNLALMPLVAAWAAGNSVVIKPSEFAQATATVLQNVLAPFAQTNEVRVVTGQAEVGAWLSSLPFDHVLFTGSDRVGRLVAKAASERLIPCTLELGGKSPVYVDESASLESAASKIYWGKWLNGGQTCIAPDYVLVNRSMIPLLVAALQRAALKAQDSPKAPGTSLCCQVHQAHADRMRTLLQEALDQGAQIECGGRWDSSGLNLEPTIVSGIRPEMRLMQEEIFGPILPLVGVDHLEEALDWVNQRPKPLSLYVFANNPEVQRRWIKETSSGSLAFNDVIVQISHPLLPFGGVGNSGWGSYHGRFGFETFSHAKAVMVHPQRPTMGTMFYPPYTPFKSRLVERFIRWMR